LGGISKPLFMGKVIHQGQPHPEIVEWLAARQARLKIASTTITPGGQTIDWVPIGSQTSGKIATPPPPERVRAPVDPERPTKRVGFVAGEPGPEGHVPILRPDISKLSPDMTLKQYRAKRGLTRFSKDKAGEKPLDPDPKGYFHAMSSEVAPVYGCDAQLNVWDPLINSPDFYEDHSISQTWVVYEGKLDLDGLNVTQTVEAGWTVDLGLNGDNRSHLFIFYTTNNYSEENYDLGGYNQFDGGWIQVHDSIFPGILLSGGSVMGGEQVELGVKYKLLGDAWWFGVTFDGSDDWVWLGYYPRRLFKGLASHATILRFGGEVGTLNPLPCITNDQMGSGVQAAGGFRHAAYQRNLQYQTDTIGRLTEFNGKSTIDVAAPECTETKYTIHSVMRSDGPWGSYQYYGGPDFPLIPPRPPRGI
jgi:hypothetical protein